MRRFVVRETVSCFAPRRLAVGHPFEIPSAEPTVRGDHLNEVVMNFVPNQRERNIVRDRVPRVVLKPAINLRLHGSVNPSLKPVTKQRRLEKRQIPTLRVVQILLKVEIGNRIAVLMAEGHKPIRNLVRASAILGHVKSFGATVPVVKRSVDSNPEPVGKILNVRAAIRPAAGLSRGGRQGPPASTGARRLAHFLGSLERKGIDLKGLAARADEPIRFVPTHGGQTALGRPT